MNIYFSLGTNLGDKENNLRLAVQYIEERIGTIVSLSAFYATAPWGFASTNGFLNAAVCVETSLSMETTPCTEVPHCVGTTLLPLEILSLTQAIERDMGRAHKSVDGVYNDRVIDIDLLICGDIILDTPQLKLPHPLMHQRRFVMEPLAEIAPDVVHPLLNKTMKELLSALV